MCHSTTRRGHSLPQKKGSGQSASRPSIAKAIIVSICALAAGGRPPCAGSGTVACEPVNLTSSHVGGLARDASSAVGSTNRVDYVRRVAPKEIRPWLASPRPFARPGGLSKIFPKKIESRIAREG
jgi:hypothetical protein